MIVSLWDDFEIFLLFLSVFLFKFIPKGYHNYQLSIFNCQLNNNFPSNISIPQGQQLCKAIPILVDITHFLW